MKTVLLRWVIAAASLWLVAKLVDGISLTGPTLEVFAIVLVFGLVNAIVRPIVKAFSMPMILLSLGLFILVLNALMFGLVARLTLGLEVDGFRGAWRGSLALSVISFILNAVFKERSKDD